MRVFITGTTGFLGQQLSSLLIKKGHKIGTLARNVAKSDRAIASNTESMIQGEKNKGISYYFGDLTDYLNIQDVLTNFKRSEERTSGRGSEFWSSALYKLIKTS